MVGAAKTLASELEPRRHHLLGDVDDLHGRVVVQFDFLVGFHRLHLGVIETYPEFFEVEML
jgi:hypothetical protein